MSLNIINIRKQTRNCSLIKSEQHNKSLSSKTISSSFKPYLSFVYQMSSNHPFLKQNKNRLCGGQEQLQLQSQSQSHLNSHQTESFDIINQNNSQSSQPYLNIIKKNYEHIPILFPRITQFQSETYHKKYIVKPKIKIPNLYFLHSKIFYSSVNGKNQSVDLTAIQLNKSESNTNHHSLSNSISNNNKDKENNCNSKQRNIFNYKKKMKQKKKFKHKDNKRMSIDIKSIISEEQMKARSNVNNKFKLKVKLNENNVFKSNFAFKVDSKKNNKRFIKHYKCDFIDKNILKSQLNTNKYRSIQHQSPIKIIQNELLLKDILANNLSYLSTIKFY